MIYTLCVYCLGGDCVNYYGVWTYYNCMTPEEQPHVSAVVYVATCTWSKSTLSDENENDLQQYNAGSELPDPIKGRGGTKIDSKSPVPGFPVAGDLEDRRRQTSPLLPSRHS
jgi:hypothetical protein